MLGPVPCCCWRLAGTLSDDAHAAARRRRGSSASRQTRRARGRKGGGGRLAVGRLQRLPFANQSINLDLDLGCENRLPCVGNAWERGGEVGVVGGGAWS